MDQISGLVRSEFVGIHSIMIKTVCGGNLYELVFFLFCAYSIIGIWYVFSLLYYLNFITGYGIPYIFLFSFSFYNYVILLTSSISSLSNFIIFILKTYSLFRVRLYSAQSKLLISATEDDNVIFISQTPTSWIILNAISTISHALARSN